MADNYNSYSPQTQQIPAQQGYQQQAPQQRYQQQMPQHSSRWQPMNDVTSTGEWFLNLFLVAIPVIGIILLFVWAFGSGTASSKKNWARANLIWILVGLILTIVICVVASLMGVDVQAVIQNSRS